MEENDIELIELIDDMNFHFFNYLMSKSVRDISLEVDIKDKYWDYIKSLEGRGKGFATKRNYEIDEVYLMIVSYVKFVYSSIKTVIPNMSSIIKNHSINLSLSPKERQVRNILIDNYNENLKNLASKVFKLYDYIVKEDVREHKDSTPLCLKLKEVVAIEDEILFIESYLQS